MTPELHTRRRRQAGTKTTTTPTTPIGLVARSSAELNRWFITHVLPHEAALTQYLRRICRDICDVPDTLQEVYIKVCAHVPEKPKSYMFEAARNFVTDQVRRRAIAQIEYHDAYDTDTLSDHHSPEHVILAGEQAEQLMEALQSLPKARREVIWMRRIQGLSQRETALRLGLKEGTVESHVCRGLQSLAEAMAFCDKLPTWNSWQKKGDAQ